MVSSTDQAIITQALIAAADEMGVKLIRSAHSPVMREAQDGSAAILDSKGRVVAQADLIPMQLGSITYTFRACLEKYPIETLKEGDFLINNDPYSGGQHLPDIFIFTPIFLEDDLIGVTSSVVHHIDLGGGAPGLNPNARDLHEEGIVFPPGKYSFSKDWNGGTLEQLIQANVRMPDATIGDINAQFASNSIGGERLKALGKKYGKTSLLLAMDEILNYSERRVRSAIIEVPDGIYNGESFLDDDGINENPIKIKVRLEIEHDEIKVDFNGTANQVLTNINNPFASTVSSSIACLKSVLTSSDIPFNDGASRPITVHAPIGSILNPKYPAPVRARMLPSYRVVNSIMDALSKAVPERVIAQGFDTTLSCCMTEKKDEGFNIYLEIFGGGFGAGKSNDGCDAVDCLLSNCSNIPIESMENDYTFFRVEDYSLRLGSGGKGAHKGGMGFQRKYKILKDNIIFATYADKFKIAPQGLFGGLEGSKAETYVEREGKKIRLDSKQTFTLQTNDTLVIKTGGGGGYGSPI